MNRILYLVLLFSFFIGAQAYFTEDFRGFLQKTYGEPKTKLLERADLEENGSYGGKNVTDEKITRQPVIFVHGIMSTAKRFHPIRRMFMVNGYSNAEIYATTWGDPQRNLIVLMVECEYVKQIRTLIKAVNLYTKKRVDLIGFSLGSVISRKAIYGGYCDGEDLGKPITNLVDTFVSVGGPNRGSAMCDQFSNIDLCNPSNGVSCDSSLLYELNSVGARYEGKNSFAIYSALDEKIGDVCCGEKCGSLANSNREFADYKFNHDRLLLATAQLQLDLVTKHQPRPPPKHKKLWPKKANKPKVSASPAPKTGPEVTTVSSRLEDTVTASTIENEDGAPIETSNLISFSITGCAILVAWILIFALIMHIVRVA